MDENGVNTLRNMIMSFRVAELQMLLGFAGKQKSGKKNELQVQALELLKGRTLTTSVQNKIKELHRQRYNNSLSYLTTSSVGNNSDSCDSDMTSNYGHSSGQMTTRSSANALHHGLHSLSSQTNSHLITASNASNISSMAKQTASRSDYYGSMPRGIAMEYPTKPYQSIPQSVSLQYPLSPDVVFKGLPFYDNLGELLKPSSLIPTVAGSRFQESMFSFHLTPAQANDVAMSREVHPGPKIEYTVQVQLRFCLNETTCEQEDNFPPSICVKINSKMCPLPNPLPTNKPGVEPKRPSRPVNITTLCKLSPTVSNQISISWAADYNRPYAVGVFLVRKLSSDTLLQRIKQKGVRNPDHTRAMIKEKLSHDPDSEIATMSLRGSLLCPLGKMRIQIPCRAITCAHIQCFDALLYLQMNEKKPTWVCPVCDKPAVFANLAIDGLFNEIINMAPTSCNEVEFHSDANWTPVVAKKENTSYETLSPGSRKTKRPLSPERSEPKRPKIDVITIDSSDDDDDETIRGSTIGPSTPVLSSGSGSESDTNQMQSLPSPDSSSSASSNVQPIGSKSNTPNPSYSVNLSSPSNGSQTMGSGTNLRVTNVSSMASRLTVSSYPNMPTLNQYYSGFPDFLNANNPFNYSNIDMSSAFDQLFRQTSDNRDVSTPSYLSTSSTSSRRALDVDPDIISID